MTVLLIAAVLVGLALVLRAPGRVLAGMLVLLWAGVTLAHLLLPEGHALLRAMGAELAFFSPLADAALPACDALWLPGGYPELHLAALSANAGMIAGLRAHHAAGKAILAECGGMLFCLDELADGAGASAAMAGILKGRATMQPRLAALGLQHVLLPQGPVRGHTFHYSRLETPLEPWAVATNPNGGHGESIYRRGRLTGSYVHFYFPSNPAAIAALLGG